MKTALVHITLESPLQKSLRENMHATPLGLGYIASFLRERGWQADLYSLKISDETNEAIGREHNLDHYDLLGFTVYTRNFLRTMSLVDYLKTLKPTLKIVLGGPQATICHGEIIRDFPNVDVVARGDGERIFLRILECFAGCGELENVNGITFRDSQEILVTPPEKPLASLDDLPPPARDFKGTHLPQHVDRYDYRKRRVVKSAVLSTSRGCPYHCSFCSIHGNSGRRWCAHSASHVIEEAGKLKRTLGVEHLYFVDANFLIDPERAHEIAHGVASLGCTFSFATRVDQLITNRELIKSFGNLGCAMIELGIESGSQSVLDKYQKGTTVRQNSEAIDILRRCGIKLGFDFIMFMPTLTYLELSESLAFLRQNGLFGIEPFETLVKCANLYPGTALRSEWEDRAGVSTSPHSLPSYSFIDEKVEKVYQAAKDFMSDYSIEVKQKVIDLRKASFALEGALASHHSGFSAPMKRKLNNIVLQCDIMNRIPFFFFERLIATVGRGEVIDPEDILGNKWRNFKESFCKTAGAMMEKLKSMEERRMKSN